jgi:ATP-dependent DNA helicase RecQ
MDDSELLSACQQKMKIESLRPGQGDVIRTLQTKKPCLAVMPTGGGKTLLWLLSTHILNTQLVEGRGQRPLTLVVVPYKALILSHLQESLSWFSCLSSENNPSELQSNINTCSVVYFTPEKLVKNIAFQEILVQNASRVQIIAIDEVHLLLEHQRFRPDIGLCINILHSRIPNAVRLAVTATSRICDSGLLLEAAKMCRTTKIVRCRLDRSNC